MPSPETPAHARPLSQRLSDGLMQVITRATVLLGASLGLGVAVNLALTGANTGLEWLGEVPLTIGGALTLLGSLLVYGFFGLIAEGVVASVTALALVETVKPWLHLVATGHPQPARGQSPLAALVAHAAYLGVAGVASGSALYNGVADHQPEWVLQAVLFIFLALILGVGGALPWLVALWRKPAHEPVSDEVVEAGGTGLIIMVATATLSIGAAMAIAGWLPTALLGGAP